MRIWPYAGVQAQRQDAKIEEVGMTRSRQLRKNKVTVTDSFRNPEICAKARLPTSKRNRELGIDRHDWDVE